ncbi:MAG TPA: hypothetical protein VND87_11145 [Stellaceae bacterium]|nr:hypothetical protein [Stellaceae bacterium]
MTAGPRRTPLWLALGFAAGLSAAVAALSLRGTGETGVQLGVILVARVAFVAFFPAYTAGALSRLVALPALARLARHGRECGLAFAGALAVHLAMVGWLFVVAAKPPVGDAVIATFGLGALWAYVLTLFSVPRFGAVFATRTGRVFRTLGMEYIAALFLYDFVVLPLETGVSHPLEYAPFVLLSIAGPLIRLAALLRQGRGIRRYSPHPP